MTITVQFIDGDNSFDVTSQEDDYDAAVENVAEIAQTLNDLGLISNDAIVVVTDAGPISDWNNDINI